MDNELNEKMNQAKTLLKTHFGYDSFRKSQDTIVQSLLSNRDVLAIQGLANQFVIKYRL